MNKHFVAVLMGSDSDWAVMQSAVSVLQAFDVPCEVRILSAHRTPHQTIDYVVDADQRGCVAFIAGAGLAAHLAGSIAAHTCKPVLGVPLESGALRGMDALLSTVQMPSGIPVACFAIGKAGAQNAAYTALQILALQDMDLTERLLASRCEMVEKVHEKDRALQASMHLPH